MFEGSVYLDTWIFNNQYTAKDKLSYYHYVHMQSYGVWRYIDVYIEIYRRIYWDKGIFYFDDLSASLSYFVHFEKILRIYGNSDTT